MQTGKKIAAEGFGCAPPERAPVRRAATLLRHGLEAGKVDSPNGGIWCAATGPNEPNDQPPLHCGARNKPFGPHAPQVCTWAFEWTAGIFTDMRFHEKNGPDWPEIYSEAMRTLSLLKKA
jgi:hypothetical protein